MARSKVAVLRVRPETVLDDLDRLHALAEVDNAFTKGAPTILKDNISWHFPFPGANTTPWQLEGTIRALRNRGFSDLVCVQNKTVVTDAFKGEDLNGYVPIFKRYDIPVRYNFKPEDMTWSVYRPKAKMRVLDTIFPEGIQIPDAFHGTNIVHLPTTKCVAGDMRVTLGDGSVVTIAELVEQQIAAAQLVEIDEDGTSRVRGDAMVFAMDGAGNVVPCRATRFARTRRNGRRLLRVTMKSGRMLVATEDHPVFAAEGWTQCGGLAVGTRVAIARRVRTAGASQRLPHTHATHPIAPVVARPGRTYSAAFNQRVIDEYRQGATVTAIAARADVRWQVAQSILKRHGVTLRRNVVPVAIPDRTSEELWRWIGYFIAEGCAEDLEKGAGKIWWTNTDPELREEFCRLSADLFGVEARVGLSIPSKAGNKHVPAMLYRCSNAEIAAFLSGYLDSDGTVSAKQAEVSATTKSERLARDLIPLFSRLGVVAFVRPIQVVPPGHEVARTYWQISVAGAAVVELAKALSLRHVEKARRLRAHVERLTTSKQPSTERAELRMLCNPDIAWDHVESIEEVAADIPLYDITVPGASSFLADGIVVHNCHIYTTTTGAMKNAFGGLLNTKRHYTHSWIHETLVDLLAIQKEIHAGLFAVMDGTTAGDGPGPRTMRPVIKDVVLASSDQVAIDAVAAQMMGFDPMSLPYISIADEAGLGNGRRENIEIVGDVAVADERWGFSVGDNGASMVGDVMWFGPLTRFQKLFFHTPLVNLFVLGSEAYHDYYRWPLRDRRVFEQWRESTHWGQLFDYYQSHGTLAPQDSAAVG